MSRKAICPGLHVWEEKGGGKFKCTKCATVFPCREQCFHYDCEDVKGPPKCEKCKKPVDSESRFYTIKGIYHEECINEQEIHTTGT